MGKGYVDCLEANHALATNSLGELRKPAPADFLLRGPNASSDLATRAGHEAPAGPGSRGTPLGRASGAVAPGPFLDRCVALQQAFGGL